MRAQEKQERRHWQAMRAWMGSFKSAIRARRGICGDEGSNLVETAISTSIVLALLFGVFDMSLCFYTYHYVSDAAREGARYAVVRGSTACANTPNLDVCEAGDAGGATEADIASYVQGQGYPGIDAQKNMTVKTYTCPSANGAVRWPALPNCPEGIASNAPGDLVKVQVTYNFPLSIPFWKQTTLKVTSTSSMPIQQ